jgi:hypothetical protein
VHLSHAVIAVAFPQLSEAPQITAAFAGGAACAPQADAAGAAFSALLALLIPANPVSVAPAPATGGLPAGEEDGQAASTPSDTRKKENIENKDGELPPFAAPVAFAPVLTPLVSMPDVQADAAVPATDTIPEGAPVVPAQAVPVQDTPAAGSSVEVPPAAPLTPPAPDSPDEFEENTRAVAPGVAMERASAPSRVSPEELAFAARLTPVRASEARPPRTAPPAAFVAVQNPQAAVPKDAPAGADQNPEPVSGGPPAPATSTPREQAQAPAAPVPLPAQAGDKPQPPQMEAVAKTGSPAVPATGGQDPDPAPAASPFRANDAPGAAPERASKTERPAAQTTPDALPRSEPAAPAAQVSAPAAVEAPGMDRPHAAVPRTAPLPAPAAPVSEPARPEAAARPVRELSVSLRSPNQAGEARPSVEVRVVERSGQVHLAVSTRDPGLAGAVRDNLGDLSAKLERTGYQAELWNPRQNQGAAELGIPAAAQASGSRFDGGQPNPGDNSGRQPGGQAGGEPGSGQRRNQDQPSRPQWFEMFEDAREGREKSIGELLYDIRH